jgi:dethiobiotin synthetase
MSSHPRLDLPPGLLVTGTDTGVGKTVVTQAIVRILHEQGVTVGAMKPVATGAVRAGDGWSGEDATALHEALGRSAPITAITPRMYEAPLAPPVAARLEGEPLTWAVLAAELEAALAAWIARGAERLVVEGVGGLLCPLTEETTVADLAVALDFPLVIVARRALGTLNHTLLTVEAAQARGLRIAGIVLNAADGPFDPAGLAETTNPGELARRVPGVPILAELDPLRAGAVVPEALCKLDWMQRALPPRWDPAIRLADRR